MVEGLQEARRAAAGESAAAKTARRDRDRRLAQPAGNAAFARFAARRVAAGGTVARARYDKANPAASKHGDIDLKEHHVVDYAKLAQFGERVRDDLGLKARRVAFRPLFPAWERVTVGELLNVRQLAEQDLFEPLRARNAQELLEELEATRTQASRVITLGKQGVVSNKPNVAPGEAKQFDDLQRAKAEWSRLTDAGTREDDPEVDQSLVMDYWVWNHANLFVGPAERVWDPTKAHPFDYYAKCFMSDVRFDRLFRLDGLLDEYLKLPAPTDGEPDTQKPLKKVLKRIRAIITKLAADNRRIEFNPAEWVLVGEKWKPLNAPDRGPPA